MASVLTDEVVEGARHGDASALTALYQAVAPGILAYLRSRGSRDAEGLTQEVFLQLLPRLRKITGGAAGVRALAFTIAHSRLIDEFRRRSRSVELPYEADLDGRRHDSAEQEAFQQLGSGEATALLATLGDEQRTVILLRVLGDLSLEETARVIGKSVGAVKQLQRRGLLALRSQAEGMGEQP
ncbi:MAG: RNA polymerase sigma factor [Aeromicrobium sp.]